MSAAVNLEEYPNTSMEDQWWMQRMLKTMKITQLRELRRATAVEGRLKVDIANALDQFVRNLRAADDRLGLIIFKMLVMMTLQTMALPDFALVYANFKRNKDDMAAALREFSDSREPGSLMRYVPPSTGSTSKPRTQKKPNELINEPAHGFNVQFKSNPFYQELLDNRGSPRVVKGEKPRHSSILINFFLSDTERAALNDPNNVLYLFCAELPNGAKEVTNALVKYPVKMELQVNGSVITGTSYKGIKNEIGSAKPFNLSDHIGERLNSPNSIKFTFVETGLFILYIKVCHRFSVPEVLAAANPMSIPKAQEIEDIKNQFQKDDGISVDIEKVSLICPITYVRIQIPVKSVKCTHIGCFDASSFLYLQEQASTWKCPLCQKKVDIADLRVSEYIKEILNTSNRLADTVSIKPDASWQEHDIVSEDDGEEDDDNVKDETSNPRAIGSSAPVEDDIIILDSDEEEEEESRPVVQTPIIEEEQVQNPLSEPDSIREEETIIDGDSGSRIENFSQDPLRRSSHNRPPAVSDSEDENMEDVLDTTDATVTRRDTTEASAPAPEVNNEAPGSTPSAMSDPVTNLSPAENRDGTQNSAVAPHISSLRPESVPVSPGTGPSVATDHAVDTMMVSSDVPMADARDGGVEAQPNSIQASLSPQVAGRIVSSSPSVHVPSPMPSLDAIMASPAPAHQTITVRQPIQIALTSPVGSGFAETTETQPISPVSVQTPQVNTTGRQHLNPMVSRVGSVNSPPNPTSTTHAQMTGASHEFIHVPSSLADISDDVPLAKRFEHAGTSAAPKEGDEIMNDMLPLSRSKSTSFVRSARSLDLNSSLSQTPVRTEQTNGSQVRLPPNQQSIQQTEQTKRTEQARSVTNGTSRHVRVNTSPNDSRMGDSQVPSQVQGKVPSGSPPFGSQPTLVSPFHVYKQNIDQMYAQNYLQSIHQERPLVGGSASSPMVPPNLSPQIRNVNQPVVSTQINQQVQPENGAEPRFVNYQPPQTFTGVPTIHSLLNTTNPHSPQQGNGNQSFLPLVANNHNATQAIASFEEARKRLLNWRSNAMPGTDSISSTRVNELVGKGPSQSPQAQQIPQIPQVQQIPQAQQNKNHEQHFPSQRKQVEYQARQVPQEPRPWIPQVDSASQVASKIHDVPPIDSRNHSSPNSAPSSHFSPHLLNGTEIPMSPLSAVDRSPVIEATNSRTSPGFRYTHTDRSFARNRHVQLLGQKIRQYMDNQMPLTATQDTMSLDTDVLTESISVAPLSDVNDTSGVIGGSAADMEPPTQPRTTVGLGLDTNRSPSPSKATRESTPLVQSSSVPVRTIPVTNDQNSSVGVSGRSSCADSNKENDSFDEQNKSMKHHMDEEDDDDMSTPRKRSKNLGLLGIQLSNLDDFSVSPLNGKVSEMSLNTPKH